MFFLLYTATFLLCWSFSRNPFFAALLATVISAFLLRFCVPLDPCPLLPPSGSDQKVIAFPACTKLKALL
jgi:hypothetical protein